MEASLINSILNSESPPNKQGHCLLGFFEEGAGLSLERRQIRQKAISKAKNMIDIRPNRAMSWALEAPMHGGYREERDS